MTDIIEALGEIVGARNVIPGPEIPDAYVPTWTKRDYEVALCLARPASAEELSRIVRAARQHRIGIVPMGGNTGPVGGTRAEGCILLTFERMNTIHEIDPLSMTLTADGGATLQEVQDAAEKAGFLFPVDIPSRGSATVGGMASTNAGGTRVLRWGMMRTSVLGLEAVLADGSIVTSLRKVLKDNAGYDWKQLFIGSEGTLGLITKVVLQLQPAPTTSETAIVATSSLTDAIKLLGELKRSLGPRVSSFELIWKSMYAFKTEGVSDPLPIAAGYPMYCIIELLGTDHGRDREDLVQALERFLDSGLILDAVVAQSERERERIWVIREGDENGAVRRGAFVNFDISMPHANMETFVARADELVLQAYPDATTLYLGHAGDGNLHILALPKNRETIAGAELAEFHHRVDAAVFTAVREAQGSISGEHGIGLVKREFLDWTRTQEEIRLMRLLKSSLDPDNILNPGKVLE